MNRRAFMAATTSVAAAAFGPLAWHELALRGDSSHASNTIIVIDASLDPAASVSAFARRTGAPVFDVGGGASDVGTLWFSTLAARLNTLPARLIGCTRASDYFVLERLAGPFDACIANVPSMSSDWTHTVVAFVFDRKPL
ncbi:hypothetical protein [Paraburkholderia sp.]|uniref:hypothetical protein n=1 Tax=Paraburkholderia sp. TaxID=1926495 RepID=UPI0023964D85|nr:hypothetical protein [Paraburkholderia sp.]MDE1184656.1 hypothetical protein [Paraburkholderia sp.]